MHVFENTKIWDVMQQKARIFISGLPNLNSFHILTRDTENNHLKQKKKITIIIIIIIITIFEILFKFSDKA